jgi:alpha,alpha-trehalase
MVFIWVIAFYFSLSNSMQTSACSIFCQGEILSSIQLSGIFQDSKTFVDMPLKVDPSIVIEAFKNISDRSNKSELKAFLDKYFNEAGSDLEEWKPTDWNPNPTFIKKLSPRYQSFAKDLNQLWYLLGKKATQDVYDHPQRHTLLTIPHPFIIPGGRFREFYYWDSYWIVRGLLVCGMTETARNIILNSAYFMDQFGVIPNGARIYYLDRSQPPLLSEMMYDYYTTTHDIQLLQKILPTLDKEYHFWMTKRAVTIEKNGKRYVLNHYNAETSSPRPESFTYALYTLHTTHSQ